MGQGVQDIQGDGLQVGPGRLAGECGDRPAFHQLHRQPRCPFELRGVDRLGSRHDAVVEHGSDALVIEAGCGAHLVTECIDE